MDSISLKMRRTCFWSGSFGWRKTFLGPTFLSVLIAVPELVRSLPAITKALRRGKVTPQKALLHPHKAPKDVKRIFERVHDREERFELNLYVVGQEEEEFEGSAGQTSSASGAGGQLPEERSPNR